MVSARHRFYVLAVFFTVLFSILVFRVYKVMVVESPQLRMKGFVEHFTYLSFLGERGCIFDSRGRVLAVSAKVYSVFACPPQVKDVSDTALKLSKVLSLPPDNVVKKLKNRNQFVWIKRRISQNKADALKRMKLKGIYMIPESKRYYPYKEIASAVLGFTGIDDQGLAGLEYEYERVLRGTRRDIVLTRDASGNEIPSESMVDASLRGGGKSICISIDAALQYELRKILFSAVKFNGAKAGVIIVMDPYSGRIISMSSYPAFDPNKFYRYSPAERINRAVSFAFEPGSTFKPFVMAAAIDTASVNFNFRIYCRGYTTYKGKVIRDWKKHGHENLVDIIVNSCNVGMVKVALKVPSKVLYNYFLGFGFGRPTGIDLPGETAGIVPMPSHWYGVGRALVGIGQGLSVSPLQLAVAMSAIANGGYLVKPYLVEAIMDNDGNVIKKTKKRVLYQVISSYTDRVLKSMLRKVVAKGTGRKADVRGYEVAGKTGTAQIPSRKGGYARGKYVSSFVGFFPVSHPEFLALVVLWEPHRHGYYGGVVVAPVFKKVVEVLISRYKIPPVLR